MQPEQSGCKKIKSMKAIHRFSRWLVLSKFTNKLSKITVAIAIAYVSLQLAIIICIELKK